MTIKNGDMPAMPVDRCDADAIDAGIHVFSGLTKREMMAMTAMQGLLAAPDLNTVEPSSVASTAIIYADAILAELERTK